jgi:hypothetical protein
MVEHLFPISLTSLPLSLSLSLSLSPHNHTHTYTHSNIGTRNFNISKKTPPYTILSPGGVNVCGSGGWYKGCGVDPAEGENVITFTLQNSLDISVDVCESSNPSNCFSIVSNETFPAGTNTIDVSLNSTQTIYNFIQANTEYNVIISSTCFKDVSNTFTVQRRPNDFVSITVDRGVSTWYPCLDYQLSIDSDKMVGDVSFSVSPALFSTQTLSIPGTTSYTHSLLEGTGNGLYTVSANPVDYDADCIPTNTYSLTVADYPANAIQISSPASSVTQLLACEATNVIGVYDSSLSSYNLGDVSWTASIVGGSEIANSDTASTVTPLPVRDSFSLDVRNLSRPLSPPIQSAHVSYPTNSKTTHRHKQVKILSFPFPPNKRL